jgi:peroxiredoxin Q/BCP
MPNPGERAPEIECMDQHNHRIRLSDFRGRKVVLFFYPKDLTPGCSSQAAAFKEKYDIIKALGAQVLGVSRDSVQSHAKFAHKLSLPFSILSDPNLRAINDYGVYREKKLYGKTAMGVVRTTFIIDENGIVEKVFDRVKAAQNAEDVIAYLSAPAK